MESEVIKQRFCKDENITIQVLDEPYFTQRVKLFNKYDNWRDYLETIEQRFNSSEQDFLAYYNSVKDNAIDYIKNSKAYKHLQLVDMQQFLSTVSKFNSFPKTDAFKECNVGRNFISIDMQKANFTSLVCYAIIHKEKISKDMALEQGDLFVESFDYNDFISRFTDMDHIKRSKYIRQVIFGNCNPKRQTQYEKYLMCRFIEDALKFSSIDYKNIYSFMTDEVILDADKISASQLKSLIEYVNNQYLFDVKIPLKVKVFRVGCIDGTNAFATYDLASDTNDIIETFINIQKPYVGVSENTMSKIEGKCMNPYESIFVNRYLKGEAILEDDLIVCVDNKLAKFLEKPEIQIRFSK